MPTWPALIADNVLSGEGAKYTVGQGLFSRQECISESGTTYYFADVSGFTNTTDGVKYSKVVRVPEWCLTNSLISLTVTGKIDAGTLSYHSKDNASGTSGTTITTTSATFVAMTSVMTVPDGTWAGTDRTLEVWAKVDLVTHHGTVSGAGCCFNLQFQRP